jgi:sigma-E factor negative regulatory protein RseA
MTQEISSLMDGELEPQAAERAIRACCASEAEKSTWYLYHAIGDSMRGHAPRRIGIPQGVVESLKAQPTVLAPRKSLLEGSFARVALAAAASVATIGVVGWIGTQGGPAPMAPIAAKSVMGSGIQPVANTRAGAPESSAEIRGYLDVHRQIASPELYRPVNNAAPATR